MKVYVVLGEYGEYSDRNVFVSGVYTSREEAEAMVVQRSAIKRIHRQWNDAVVATLYLWRPEGQVGSYSDTQRQMAEEQIGPEPEYEFGESFEIVEAEIGEWLSGKDSAQIILSSDLT